MADLKHSPRRHQAAKLVFSIVCLNHSHAGLAALRIFHLGFHERPAGGWPQCARAGGPERHLQEGPHPRAHQAERRRLLGLRSAAARDSIVQINISRPTTCYRISANVVVASVRRRQVRHCSRSCAGCILFTSQL
ncbi:hypothetical protein PPTG_08166 [Phytophthora nicotianae INRA-310]|uniref:Uncharacterized protein n=1 Tax=Phytophthora nicotianae (strain INRA-310) TaxID=761204 RepID=W2QJG4_PHYN3|nr:hypothetical protein PPTG_08166 [Phytophthora nicotianae INRA-310]ETN13287.1 hypothetical protein PPTG_08166 [Phytophthora nicotianae INRA-310]